MKTKLQKSLTYLFFRSILIMAALLLTGCFSPWADDQAVITLNFRERGIGRSILYQDEMNELEHIIELIGPEGPLQKINVPEGTASVRIPVETGLWEINVEALNEGFLFAEGSAVEEIKPGVNQISITMNPIDFIRVSSSADLEKIGNDPAWPLGGNYRMDRDIDISDINWIPIGTTGDPFTGSFDGRGYTISGLTITDGGADSSLFGVISNTGMVRNLCLTEVNISGTPGSSNLGGIAGTNHGTIEYCSVYGSEIIGLSAIGGLVGYNDGTVRNSYANIQVTSYSINAGGLVGFNDYGGDLTENYASGDVIAFGNNAGGLVGLNRHLIYNSFASGNVTGGNDVGGLAGSTNAPINTSYALGNVSGNDNVGGLVGWTNSLPQSITRNAALNNTIIAKGANAGRVLGNDSPNSLENNFARSNMAVFINNDSGKTISKGLNTIDGEDMILPITAEGWYSLGTNSTLNWGFSEEDVWRWDSALGRPVLRHVGPGADRAPIGM